MPPKLNKEVNRTKGPRQPKLRWPRSELMSVSNEILTASAIQTASESKPLTRTLRSFIVLAKPEITLMVMISAGIASVLASDSLRIVVLLKAVFGTGLLAAGASVLNQ